MKGIDYKELPDVFLIFISKFDTFGEHQNFKKLCNRVRYFKEDQEGVKSMCEAVQEYAQEYAAKVTQQENIQTAMNLLRNGASVDLISQSIPSLSRQFIVELSKQIHQPADQEGEYRGRKSDS